MRVVLFDIDGTLLLTGRAGQHAMHAVATENASLDGEASQLSFSGRTDRAIISDYFRMASIEDTEENFLDFCGRFLESLPEQLQARGGQVLPGVFAMLERLANMTDVTLGLLTGNMQAAARLKLRHFALDQYFYDDGEPLGAFGDVHHHRDDVARAAYEDLQNRLDPSVAGSDIWIIGDTPLDVQCARAISARVLAVATGGSSLAELQQTEPDWLLPDLDQADEWWHHFLQEDS